jgi:dihydrofolate reductase
MGRIVSNFFMSLDGVVERPDQWHFPYFNDEMGTAIGKGMETNAAFLMGRVLYEEWAAFWPSSEDEIAEFFNRHPKYVVSNSLESASWKQHDDRLRRRPTAARRAQGGDRRRPRHLGQPELVRSLLADGLVDELRVLIHPIVVGHGARLFEDPTAHGLELVDHEVFTTGVLNLAYKPAAA